jgi:hypothetical protein
MGRKLYYCIYCGKYSKKECDDINCQLLKIKEERRKMNLGLIGRFFEKIFGR